jgi:hypothetical protein
MVIKRLLAKIRYKEYKDFKWMKNQGEIIKMKRLRKTRILFCLLFVLLNPYEISAHSGNTDSYGGHNKTADGTYHCHSGQCLEDAMKRAYKIAFPSGQEDGRLGKENGYEEYENALWERVQTGEIDPEEAEYMIPYVLMAYQEGFKDTYVPPTFWEKYENHIIGSLLLIGVLGILGGVIRVLSNKKSPPYSHKATQGKE